MLLALFILAALIWTALDLNGVGQKIQVQRTRDLPAFPAVITVILFIQLLFGAYVAGLNAGAVSNSRPLMNGHFVPAGIESGAGWLHAVLNDPYLIHFIHRWWAWILVVTLVIMARRVKALGARHISVAIHSAFGIQILLGIATVMTGVNITLAVLHQAVGALVVATVAWGAHRLGQEAKG